MSFDVKDEVKLTHDLLEMFSPFKLLRFSFGVRLNVWRFKELFGSIYNALFSDWK